MPDVIQIAIQATDLASKVIGGVGDSLDKLDKSTDSAEKKLKIFGLTTDQIGSKMSQAGKIATIGLTVPIAGLAAASIKAASDLNETANKIDTLFGSASNEIKKFADTAATSLGQSKKQALDAAATFAVFGKSAGLAGQDLVKFSEQNVTLAADMASFFNTSPEEAITAIGAAFRGESEPIRRYGVLLDDASLKQQALRMGLIKTTTEALQPQQRVLAAQALIMQQTSAAQGDFAKTSDGLANQTRILEAQFQDVVSTLGQSLLPVAVKVAGVANDILTAFNNLDQPTKDLIVGFGLMAAAAGPVLTVAGKLVPVFGTLANISIDVSGKFITMGKSVIDVAGTLQRIGVTSYTVQDALIRLKASGALLTGELTIIVAGLIAVAKYLGEVDAASKATNDSLIEMSHSGDVFKQAAATTEILTNGQERLKKTLDGVKAELESGKRTYADYRSSIEATAKAAGYEIDAQGNLVSAMDRGMGAGKLLIQTNYALSESEYAAAVAARDHGAAVQARSDIFDQGAKKTEAIANILNYLATKQVAATPSGAMNNALKEYYTSMRDANAEGLVRANDQAIQSIDALRTAMQGAVTKEFENFKNKQSELQGKADELQKVISTSYGKARDDAIKSLDDINTQLAGNVKAHDEATKRILFDIASQQLATIQDPQLRAKAMNELALQWNLVDKATYDATQNIIGATAKLAEDKNLTAYQSALNGIATTAAGMPVAEVKIDTEGSTRKLKEYDETLGSIPKEVTTKVKTVIEELQGTAGDSMKERLKQLSPTVTTKVGIDTTQAEKDLNNYTANKINLLPGVKKTEIVADTAKATTDTNSILNLYGLIPATKKTLVDVDGKAALQILDDILKGLNDLYSKTIVITTKYVTVGSPPSGGAGYATGANFVVPAGYPNDTFPMRVSSGERVIVQPQAQQGNVPSARSGDVYNYTTNVYNPLAAAMLADKQRREKIARSNARMGVNA